MFASVAAGSVHTDGSTTFQPWFRCGTAVSVRPTRVTAPWKCSNRIDDIGDGIVENRSTATSIRSSESSGVKLDSQ